MKTAKELMNIIQRIESQALCVDMDGNKGNTDFLMNILAMCNEATGLMEGGNQPSLMAMPGFTIEELDFIIKNAEINMAMILTALNSSKTKNLPKLIKMMDDFKKVAATSKKTKRAIENNRRRQ